MIELIGVLVLFWLLGIVRIPWLVLPHFTAFTFLGFSITLERLLIFGIVIWLASSLNSPFRQILWAFVVLWLLSLFGVVTIGSTTTMIVIAIVAGLILTTTGKGKRV